MSLFEELLCEYDETAFLSEKTLYFNTPYMLRGKTLEYLIRKFSEFLECNIEIDNSIPFGDIMYGPIHKS